MNEQQEELCSNCRGNPKLPDHWLCFHCLVHYQREHRRKRFNRSVIVFCCSPVLFVVYINLIIRAWLIHELLAWVVIIGFPTFFIWFIFGQKQRWLPPPPPRAVTPSIKFRFCIYCGKPIENVKFCVHCGMKVEGEI